MLYNPKVRKDLVKKLYQVKHSTPQKTPIGNPETYGGTGISFDWNIIGHINKRVFLAGNIGVSPLQLLSKLKMRDVVILELSSFQLEDATQSPDVAVALNVVPEHLDRHQTFAKYLKAKANIYKYQSKNDWLVASSDFELTRSAAKKSKSKKFIYSTRKVLAKGLYVAKGDIIYRHIVSGKRRVVTKTENVSLMGEHNLQNILPAIAVALIHRVPMTHIAKKLGNFKSLPHRLELVDKKGKVLFVNDSSGTTPVAAMAATQSFAYMNTALIVGGVYKGGDIEALAKTAQKHGVVFVALIGKSTPLFYKAFKRFAPDVEAKGYKTFISAIKGAHASVRDRGGVVILAPAAASFDMFKDAYQRGDKFKEIVKSL